MEPTITITVPLRHDALIRASNMLLNIATDLSKKDSETTVAVPVTTPVDSVGVVSAPVVYPTSTPEPGSVELDADGLPWDVRIHSSKKSKLAKSEQWKKRRGVDATLVEQVEIELRAAMAVPAPSMAPPPAMPAPTAAPPAASTLMSVTHGVEGIQYTTEQLIDAGWTTEQIDAIDCLAETSITTFPELMAKITEAMGAGIITDANVSAAVSKQGLASLPLLAARPDLIPNVMTELFE